METITRKYAKAAGLSKYFTGQPCLHGHTAYRYVKSGACSACVKSANGGAPMGDQPRRSTRGEHIEVPPEMPGQLTAFAGDTTTARVAVYDDDAVTIHEVGRALLERRYPALDPAVFRAPMKVVQRMGGVSLYTIRCHPEDAGLLRDTGKAMVQGRNDAHRLAERIYETVLARNLAEADAERPGPPALAPGVLT